MDNAGELNGVGVADVHTARLRTATAAATMAEHTTQPNKELHGERLKNEMLLTFVGTVNEHPEAVGHIHAAAQGAPIPLAANAPAAPMQVQLEQIQHQLQQLNLQNQMQEQQLNLQNQMQEQQLNLLNQMQKQQLNLQSQMQQQRDEQMALEDNRVRQARNMHASVLGQAMEPLVKSRQGLMEQVIHPGPLVQRDAVQVGHVPTAMNIRLPEVTLHAIGHLNKGPILEIAREYNNSLGILGNDGVATFRTKLIAFLRGAP